MAKRYWKVGRGVFPEDKREGNFITVNGKVYRKDGLPKNMKEATREEYNAARAKEQLRSAEVGETGADVGVGASDSTDESGQADVDAVGWVYSDGGDNVGAGEDS